MNFDEIDKHRSVGQWYIFASYQQIIHFPKPVFPRNLTVMILCLFNLKVKLHICRRSLEIFGYTIAEFEVRVKMTKAASYFRCRQGKKSKEPNELKWHCTLLQVRLMGNTIEWVLFPDHNSVYLTTVYLTTKFSYQLVCIHLCRIKSFNLFFFFTVTLTPEPTPFLQRSTHWKVRPLVIGPLLPTENLMYYR